ncbi:MAG: hypothetical protein HYZ45_10045 [Burkholderiales bacterium]|nr:hypothetical protein [Burkholderiales bacterium]
MLGTLPACVNVLAGYAAGRLLQRYPGAAPACLWRLLAWGCAALTVGMLWQLVLPLNKKLWTSSYVLVTLGIDLLLLALLLLLIERWQWQRWTSLFASFGRNTLAIYLLSEIVVIILINWRLTSSTGSVNAYDALYQRVFLPLAGPLNGSLLFAFATLLLCWLCAWYLDKRRIYIRL